MKEAFIEVGRVVGAHGVRGKVKVEAWSGDPSGLLTAGRIRVGGRAGAGAEREYEVKAAHRSGGCAVFLLEGIGSAAEANGLRGAAVSLRRSDLPPAGVDEYYWVDLVGCEVVDGEGRPLGVVAGVTEGTAYDWLVVRRGDGEALLPMVEAFIRRVDLAGRRITASPPEGW